MTTHASFPCQNPSEAILCREDKGPTFGRGGLEAIDEPFNKLFACLSYANEAVYSIPKNTKGINMLTNQKNDNEIIFEKERCSFTISELEVWGVSVNE